MAADQIVETLRLPMTVSPECVDFIKGWEDCRLIPYLDGGGVLTCGWGHALPVNAPRSQWTQQEADDVLAADIRQTAMGLRSYIFRETTQQQFDALASLAFNCGVMAIGNSGLMSRFNSGLDAEVPARWILWNHDGGVIVPGLTRRREAEIRIFSQGDYSGRP